MPLRNRVIVEDFSCKDTYCFGSGLDKKLLDKDTYNRVTYADELYDDQATAPQDTSVTATDGVAVGTLADAGYTTPIIADRGFVVEIYDDFMVYWQAAYDASCAISWTNTGHHLSQIDPDDAELDCAGLTA